MKKNNQHGESTEKGFKVQVRDPNFSTISPCVIADGIVGPEWRDIYFEKGNNPAGIPIEPFGSKDAHGLLTFQGATALAWTVIAQNRLNSLECRLVAYELRTTYEIERLGIVDQPIVSPLFREIPMVPEPQEETL